MYGAINSDENAPAAVDPCLAFVPGDRSRIDATLARNDATSDCGDHEESPARYEGADLGRIGREKGQTRSVDGRRYRYRPFPVSNPQSVM